MPVFQGRSLMGNDNKTVRSKILDWQFFVKIYGLFYITLLGLACLLSALAVQEFIENQLTNFYVKSVAYSHLSNKRGAHAYQFWKIPPSSKKNPPSSFIDFITKVSDIIAEPDDNFSHDHFEL